MEMSGQFHAPAALHRDKQPRYPLVGKLGGTQSWYWCGDEKNPIISCGGNGTPVVQPIA
jgi:hypothetical protein